MPLSAVPTKMIPPFPSSVVEPILGDVIHERGVAGGAGAGRGDASDGFDAVDGRETGGGADAGVLQEQPVDVGRGAGGGFDVAFFPGVEEQRRGTGVVQVKGGYAGGAEEVLAEDDVVREHGALVLDRARFVHAVRLARQRVDLVVVLREEGGDVVQRRGRTVARARLRVGPAAAAGVVLRADAERDHDRVLRRRRQRQRPGVGRRELVERQSRD
nr:hypothetical protein CFP56_50871 [Quercus suber]